MQISFSLIFQFITTAFSVFILITTVCIILLLINVLFLVIKALKIYINKNKYENDDE